MIRKAVSVCCTSLLFCLFSTAILAQGSVEVVQVPALNLKSRNTLPFDSLQRKPYCTVSLSVHNFEKLNSHDYRQGIHKLASFTVNATIKSNLLKGEDLEIPVFLVNFEKNKFTEISHQQAVLVNKLLLNTAAIDVPTVKVSTETVDRNSIAMYINVLKQMNSVLQAATCPGGWASTAGTAAGSFSDFLGSITADKDSKGEWSFPVLPVDQFTRPYSYTMFILKPDNEFFPMHQAFYIKNNEAWIADGAARYTKFPYILVTTSFSDYLSEDQLPSTLAVNQLDQLSLAQAKVKLYSLIGRISQQQFNAEENLLQRYTTYLEMKSYTDQVPSFKNPTELKSKALDKYFAYRQLADADEYMRSEEIFRNHIGKLNDYVESMAGSLGYYSTIADAVKLYKCDNSEEISERDLPRFHYYRSVMQEVPFIRNSYFYQSMCSKIEETEQQVYEKHYEVPLASFKGLMASNNLNDKDKLAKAKPLYDSLTSQVDTDMHCRSCRDSIEKAMSMYESIENSKASQVKIQLLINCTRYADSLSARLNIIDEQMKDTALKAEKKTVLSKYRDQLAGEIGNINKERNAFINTDVRPKNDFKNEKDRVEAELKNAQTLLLGSNKGS